MTILVIIFFCVLLLLGYLFEISAAFTKIPSVILFISLGFAVNFIFTMMNISRLDISEILPLLGTIGLILIVLEGSLELELNSKNYTLIAKSFSMAFAFFWVSVLFVNWLFGWYGDSGHSHLILNSIPFCVISSAIAIPSTANLIKSSKDFVIYESSLSDIIGVIAFNLFLTTNAIHKDTIVHFSGHLILIILISFFSVIGLSYLLAKIKHHITYVPIILLVILFYAVSKYYHLPGLIFVLIFGLFLGNLDEIKDHKLLRNLHVNTDKLEHEIKKFKQINAEVAFIIRALFFVIFGYSLSIPDIINFQSLPIALLITIGLLAIRVLCLLSFRVPLQPLWYFAPKGLITVLLFLSIPAQLKIPLVNNSLTVQVVLFSVFILMVGNIFYKKVV